MWWRISETIAKANVGAMPTDEITVSQGWTMGTRNVHEHATCASGILSPAQGVLRQERSCLEQRAQDMLRRKVHVERNDTALDLGSGSDSRSGPTVLFTTTWHPPKPLGERTVPASTSPTVQHPNQLVNQGIRSWSRDVHAWKVRASDRKGEVQEPVSRLSEIFQKRERPDGTKDVPLTSEVRQQTSHY